MDNVSLFRVAEITYVCGRVPEPGREDSRVLIYPKRLPSSLLRSCGRKKTSVNVREEIRSCRRSSVNVREEIAVNRPVEAVLPSLQAMQECHCVKLAFVRESLSLGKFVGVVTVLCGS